MIYKDTWMKILQIVRESGKDSLLRVMVYYASRSGEVYTQEEVRKATGVNNKTVRGIRDILTTYGFITVESVGRKLRITVENPLENIFYGDVPILSYIISIYSTVYKDNNRHDPIEKIRTSDFTVEDIDSDEDWLKAEPILKKYFKPFQYHPQHLVTKKRYFSPLVKLITDPEVDFDGYCHWYRIHKYPKYKFNYGMFLTPGMIAEYRNTLESDEDSRYTNTSRMHESESFKKSVEESQDFLDEIGREVDET